MSVSARLPHRGRIGIPKRTAAANQPPRSLEVVHQGVVFRRRSKGLQHAEEEDGHANGGDAETKEAPCARFAEDTPGKVYPIECRTADFWPCQQPQEKGARNQNPRMEQA